MSDELIAALLGAVVAFSGSTLLLFMSSWHASRQRDSEYRRFLKNILSIIVQSISRYEQSIDRLNTFDDVPIGIIGEQIQLFWRIADSLALHLDEGLFSEVYEIMAETAIDQRYWFTHYETYKIETAQGSAQNSGALTHEFGKRLISRKARLSQLRGQL